MAVVAMVTRQLHFTCSTRVYVCVCVGVCRAVVVGNGRIAIGCRIPIEVSRRSDGVRVETDLAYVFSVVTGDLCDTRV